MVNEPKRTSITTIPNETISCVVLSSGCMKIISSITATIMITAHPICVFFIEVCIKQRFIYENVTLKAFRILFEINPVIIVDTMKITIKEMISLASFKLVDTLNALNANVINHMVESKVNIIRIIAVVSSTEDRSVGSPIERALHIICLPNFSSAGENPVEATSKYGKRAIA